MQTLIKGEPHRKSVQTGPDAKILYFTGHTELINTITSFDRLRVERRPGFNTGGKHEGDALKDEVAISLCFDNPIVIKEALFQAYRIVDYLGLLIGRPQEVSGLYVEITENLSTNTLLQVESMHGERSSRAPNDPPSSYDVLLDGTREPKEFTAVMISWLDRSESWRDARWRFFNSYAEENLYDINRLIASANMFDVLPPSAVPSDNALAPELADARDACRKAFRALPNNPERESVLSCLGRLGKSSLKRKIRHRVQMLQDQAGEFFFDLTQVTDEAVNCRNFFVHGSPGTFDYERNFEMVTFFTNTLEFVFAVSDLIEAGWNFAAWLQKGSTLRHPMDRYKVSYRFIPSQLLVLLSKNN